MIKNLTLLSLILLSLSQAIAQNVGKLFYLDDNNRLATLDPNTAGSTAISANAVFGGTLVPGSVAVDNEGNRLFLVSPDAALGAQLITVDLNTGEPLSTLTLDMEPKSLDYHCLNGLLYAIDEQNNLVSIDPANGAVEAIAPIASTSVDFSTPTLDPYGDRLFFISFEPLGLRLSAVSAATGAILASLDIGDDISFQNMAYNCRDGLLYGLLNNGGASFARLSPMDGNLTPLSGPIAANGFLANSHSLSQSRQAYTFSGQDENGAVRLYTVSLLDGAIVSQPVIGTEYFLNSSIAYANRCAAEADFGLAVGCAADTTRFTNTSTPGATFLWNFGDPASGAANTSAEANPTHVYNNPGVYTITLVATDCGADTLSKEVIVPGLSVPPFPDTTLSCEDDFPVTINAFTEGATYLWQDGSADSVFIVEAADVPVDISVEITLGACMVEFSTFAGRDEDANCPCLLVMPNTFTPNGDSHNDFFRPVDRNCRIKAGSYTLRVYNRWGEMVFESTDPGGNGWDGNYKNEPVPNEVYFYTLQYISETDQGDVPDERKGDLTLLR
ncbi:MAG: gliding motility-associated C-terminal domain-containing protein [Lewinellaceae bacterium]|nr:gliding motility-associated C-terminal domain-containing protein [Phaeodactylibacter sp.]MCB9036131.1 gliding motility-associated C-terminal domain-containing protein [Lewinellaceae bacterium]